jgi:FeS assembly SUF system protein
MEENEVKTNAEVLTAEDVKELTPLYENVILALKQVYDPEIPVNIYDLGLIYELNIRKSREVYIKMTFTAPNCPMADEVMAEVKRNVEDVPNVKGCSIDLVFEPVWDQSMMSDEAKVTLGFDVDFDDAPQADDVQTDGTQTDAAPTV